MSSGALHMHDGHRWITYQWRPAISARNRSRATIGWGGENEAQRVKPATGYSAARLPIIPRALSRVPRPPASIIRADAPLRTMPAGHRGPQCGMSRAMVGLAQSAVEAFAQQTSLYPPYALSRLARHRAPFRYIVDTGGQAIRAAGKKGDP